MTDDEFMQTLKALTEDALTEGVSEVVVQNGLMSTFCDLAVLMRMSPERATYLLLAHLADSKRAYETRKMQ